METTKENMAIQDFINKYNQLCKETGYKILITPKWIARDDGSYSMVIVQSVVKEIKKIE